MLHIKDLEVNYGSFRALQGVNLHVKHGEIVALLGSNGAGKTTTINAVSGLRNVVGGDIILKGESILGLAPHDRVKHGIVQVPEGRMLFPYMSVEENLMVGSYLPEARKKRAETLKQCYEIFPKLYERKTQFAGSLSGGEQQMCAIARALMQQPKLLMLDEPSLGLAPVIIDTIFDVILDLRKRGLTILLVEQNVQATLDVCDRAYVIETGQDVVTGTGAELASSDLIRQAYLGI